MRRTPRRSPVANMMPLRNLFPAGRPALRDTRWIGRPAAAVAMLALAFAALPAPPLPPPAGAMVAPAPRPPAQEALEIQFIANAAVRLSDGSTTLVTDFPYRSGYAGYMTWSLEGIGSLAGATAIVTHEHADHWERELWEATDLRIAAAPAITAGLERSRVRPWSGAIGVGAATVRPVRTAHTEAHHSYRISWRGLELYFSGDTESTAEILAQQNLDVAFVSSWLLQAVAREGRRIDADLVAVYHHTGPGEVPDAEGRWVPERGEVRRVPFPVSAR